MLTLATSPATTDCLQFMEDMNAKNLETLSRWFTDESYMWVPPCQPVIGLSRIMAMFRAIFRRYESINWTVKEIFQIELNRFLIFHQSEAVFKNGITYNNEIITDITFNEQTKIIRLSDYFKNTAVLG